MTKLRQQRMVLYLQPHTSVPGTEPAGEISHKTKQMQCTSAQLAVEPARESWCRDELRRTPQPCFTSTLLPGQLPGPCAQYASHQA